MSLPQHARLAVAVVAGVIAPYLWAAFNALWGVYVFLPLGKTLWPAFALRGPIVYWMNYVLTSVLFGALVGLGLWALGRHALPRFLVSFSIAFLIAFFGPGFVTSTSKDMVALVSISAPSIILLLGTMAGTCYILARCKERAGA